MDGESYDAEGDGGGSGSLEQPKQTMEIERTGQPQPLVADTLQAPGQKATRAKVTFDHRKPSLPRMTTTRVRRLGLITGHLFRVRDSRRFLLLVADLTLLRIAR